MSLIYIPLSACHQVYLVHILPLPQTFFSLIIQEKRRKLGFTDWICQKGTSTSRKQNQ